MRSLVTYRPYRPSPVNIDRWFDSLFQDWSRPACATAAPRVDVREEADGYHLEAELPGLTEKKILRVCQERRVAATVAAVQRRGVRQPAKCMRNKQ